MTTNPSQQNTGVTPGKSPHEERPFLAPLGWFWSLLRDTLLAALMVGILLLVSGRVAASLSFVIPALWVTLFIGSMGFILGNMTRTPLQPKDKIFILLAVLLKITLFIAGAAGVLLSLKTVQAEPGLAIWILAGLHLMLVLALFHWIIRSSASKPTVEAKSDPGMGSEPSLL